VDFGPPRKQKKPQTKKKSNAVRVCLKKSEKGSAGGKGGRKGADGKQSQREEKKKYPEGRGWQRQTGQKIVHESTRLKQRETSRGN